MNDFADRLPPQDLEAERFCIGACLSSTSAIAETLAIARPEHFFDAFNRAALVAIASLWDRGVTADPFSVVREMSRAGQELSDSPAARLNECIVGSLTVASLVRAYATEVRNAAERRRLIDAAVNIANEAWAPKADPSEVTDRAVETLLLGAENRQRATSANVGEVLAQGLMADLLEELDQPDLVRGMQCGWGLFDHTLGGFAPSAVYTILADTSVGKSWLVAWLAWAVAAKGHRPLIVTTEMNRKEVTRRLVYMQAGIDPDFAKNSGSSAPDFIVSKVNQAAQALKDESRISICDVGKIGLDTLVSEVRRQRVLRGCDIVFIDHIQHIRVRGIRPGDTVARIEEVTASTKGIAMNEDIPVVQVSHINRNAALSGRPGTHGGKGGGSIEQDSNVQIEMTRVFWGGNSWEQFLTDDDANAYARSHNKIPIEIRVNKNRSGGKAYDVRYLDWNQGGRFVPIALGGNE